MARVTAGITFNKRGWDKVAQEIVETEGVRRMKRVADAANSGLKEEGYKVSTEGDEKLTKRDYTATVIAATYEAQRDNAKNNTLINDLHHAGGA